MFWDTRLSRFLGCLRPFPDASKFWAVGLFLRGGKHVSMALQDQCQDSNSMAGSDAGTESMTELQKLPHTGISRHALTYVISAKEFGLSKSTTPSGPLPPVFGKGSLETHLSTLRMRW